MTLTEFLTARLDEDEIKARRVAEATHGGTLQVWLQFRDGPSRRSEEQVDAYDPARVLAEVDAKRRIVALHKSWPVLVETAPELTSDTTDLNAMSFSMSKQVMWLTNQEYRARFGDEPPTAPVLRLLALPYAEHPDYRQEWKP